MSEVQPGSPADFSNPVPVKQGVLGTKIPSTVAFGIGVLLFFMPFVDIRCNGMKLQTVNGVQLATGFEIKGPGSDDTVLGGLEKLDRNDQDLKNKTEARDPNLLALAAFILGVLTLVLSLLDKKQVITTAVITACLAVAALVGTMIDINRQVTMDVSGRRKGFDFRELDREMVISVDFTPWFYLTIIAFAVGAWFSYRRLR